MSGRRRWRLGEEENEEEEAEEREQEIAYHAAARGLPGYLESHPPYCLLLDRLLLDVDVAG